MRKTKIVCTLGPSTDQPGILRQLLENGMNVARFNFSHGDYADLRAFGIQHCRNGNVKLFAQCAQLIQTAFVFRVIAMRKIEACNIHPVFQQLAQNAGYGTVQPMMDGLLPDGIDIYCCGKQPHQQVAHVKVGSENQRNGINKQRQGQQAEQK